jgi:hypothetical protein
MFRVEVAEILGGGDWFLTKDEDLEFVLAKAEELFIMPRGTANRHAWAPSIVGPCSTEMLTFRDLKMKRMTADKLASVYLFDDDGL